MKNLNGELFPLVDPMRFLVDDEIRPFMRDQRHDLTASDAPKTATGVFVVYDHVVPDNQVEIVMGVATHLWARTDPADAVTESLAVLPDADMLMGAGQGWWVFNMLKGGQQPYIAETNYNRPRKQASAQDNDRFVLHGSTWLPGVIPAFAQFGFNNSLTPTLVPAGTKFQVTFQLAPTAAAAVATPNPYRIGSGANRIDCAGACVFGLTMPSTLYNKLSTARRNGMLGAEAG